MPTVSAFMTTALIGSTTEPVIRNRITNVSPKIVPSTRKISSSGSQYASEHYQRVLSEEGITCSMSGVGQCWDNAPMESFFASLKKELVHHEDYATRDEAKAFLSQKFSIEVV